MIGVFDSGVGGLTVLKEFLKRLPQYNYIYLGDNARAPYGEKSQEAIFNYTKEAVDFLFKKKCGLIILACNTASSQALRRLQREYLPKNYPGRRILGVVRPLAEKMAGNDNIKRIGVIGTRATIGSKVYEKELRKNNPGLRVFGQSAPLLVPLIEEGFLKKSEEEILKGYLQPLKEKRVQGLIIACTHYPFLYKEIIKIMGKKCRVDNPGEIVALSLKKYLSRHPELGIKESPVPQCRFFTTGDTSRFKILGEKFLKRKIGNIKKIAL
jgi:glutamate racemase